MIDFDDYRRLVREWRRGTITPDDFEVLEDTGFFDDDDRPYNESDDSYEGKYNDGR